MEPLDPREAKTLADILALVLDENEGQASSALKILRRRARTGGVTGGAIKNIFARLSGDVSSEGSADTLPQGSVERQLAFSRMEAATLAAELAKMEQRLRAHEQRRNDRPRQQIALGLAFIVGCSVAGLGWVLFSSRQSPQAAPAAATQIPDDITPMLTDNINAAILTQIARCWQAAGETPAQPPELPVSVQVKIDESGVTRAAHVAPWDADRDVADPDVSTFIEKADKILLSPACARLPLPTYFLGHPHTLTLRFSR